MSEDNKNNNNNDNKQKPTNRKKTRRNNNSRRNNRRRRGGKQRRERSVEDLERDYINKVRKDDSIEKPICPLCEKPIFILSQAIIHKESGERAHFDCIVKKLRDSNELEKNERIVYLGGGSFGIIQDRSVGRSKVKFFVRKRIQYEERTKDGRPEERRTENRVEETSDNEKAQQ